MTDRTFSCDASRTASTLFSRHPLLFASLLGVVIIFSAARIVAGEPMRPYTPEFDAQARARAGRLMPLDVATPEGKSLQALLSGWSKRNVPFAAQHDLVFNEPVCNPDFCAACVGVRASQRPLDTQELYGCILVDRTTSAPIRETFMPRACAVLEKYGHKTDRPLIRSIASLREPPNEVYEIADATASEFVVVVDADGKITAVPVDPYFGFFDRMPNESEDWLTATFAGGLKFEAEPGAAQTIVELEYDLKPGARSLELEITESDGCWERTWSSAWPHSPEWKVSGWKTQTQP